MSINIGKAIRATLLISSMVSVTLLSTGLQADTGTCRADDNLAIY
jgi:hypothetical protein